MTAHKRRVSHGDSPSPALVGALARALDRIASDALVDAGVIEWGSPVPAFGDPSRSTVATVGINPSNREFVDESGEELVGRHRRFHTLFSLGIESWEDADARHLQQILETSEAYFSNNPYDGWFRRLDHVISGVGGSFYGETPNACHLDLIPFATTDKWTRLTTRQRSRLLESSGDILGCLVRDSPIQTLVLNGRTVVSNFEDGAGITFARRVIPSWRLSRNSPPDVVGVAFTGIVTSLGGVSLERDVLALGFNHNLQSGFGVTKAVIRSIREWLARATDRRLS